jgi:hypothetical protein
LAKGQAEVDPDREDAVVVDIVWNGAEGRLDASVCRQRRGEHERECVDIDGRAG